MENSISKTLLSVHHGRLLVNT